MGILDAIWNFDYSDPLGRGKARAAEKQQATKYDQISQARKSIRSLASQLDPENQAQVLAANSLSRQLPLAQRQQLLASTLSSLPQLVIQNAGDQARLRTQQQQTALGSQYLQNQLQPTVDYYNAQAANTRALIPSVPAQFQGLMEVQAQQQERYGKQLADAFLQQYQAQPLLDYYQRKLASQGKSLNSNSGGYTPSQGAQSLYGQ